MKTKSCVYLSALLVSLSLSASAASYPGNGSSAWGGAVGLGSLSLTDDGTTVNLTLPMGALPLVNRRYVIVFAIHCTRSSYPACTCGIESSIKYAESMQKGLDR